MYVIGDLHLSFGTNKPMDVFGTSWENYTQKLKTNWQKEINSLDTVIIPGDFSWGTYLKDTLEDFKYLDTLPGNKILLKGNHDYWWDTVSKCEKFLEENEIKNVKFLKNNSYYVEDKIICGTRGWVNTNSESDIKILRREYERLKISLESGVKEFGHDKDIYVFMHYPPFLNDNLSGIDFIALMKKYNVKKCFYGHLHGKSIEDAKEGIIDKIEFKLVSADYLKFNPLKV